MVANLRFFSVFLLVLCFYQEVSAQCSIANISVSQSATGAIVSGKPEYEVTVRNNCICSQMSLHLSCEGFQSVETVDSSVFKPSNCSVNNGLPVFQDYPIKFKYAWDTQFSLNPVHSQINCS